jgi:hypothetical protein
MKNWELFVFGPKFSGVKAVNLSDIETNKPMFAIETIPAAE